MRSFLFLGCVLAFAVGGCDRAQEAATPETTSAPAPTPAVTDGAPGPGGFGPPGDQTLDEMLERARAGFSRMDRDGDGQVTAEERQAMRAEFGGGEGRGRGRGGGGMMGRADADGDGQVTLAEAEAQARARFARMDADKDGTVTVDERRAAFPRMRGGG
jgi:hypothetical protein